MSSSDDADDAEDFPIDPPRHGATTDRLVDLYVAVNAQLGVLCREIALRAEKTPDAPAGQALILRANRMLRDAAACLSRLPAARHVRQLPPQVPVSLADLAVILAQARAALVAFPEAYRRYDGTGEFWHSA